MIPHNLLELAHQGHPQATQKLAAGIESYLRRPLRALGIAIAVQWQQGQLEIWLTAETWPAQTKLVDLIQRGLGQLPVTLQDVGQAIPGLSVGLYAQQPDQPEPLWQTQWDWQPAATSPTPSPELPAIAPSLRELSQQGDLSALTTLLNQALAHKQITAEIERQADTLQVVLQSDPPPVKTVATVLVYRTLMGLKLTEIAQVELVAQAGEAGDRSWTHTFALTPESNPARVDVQILPMVPPAPKKSGIPRPLQWRSLLPYQDILQVDLYGNGTLRLLFFLSLFPLLVKLLLGQTEHLALTAWVLGIYYAFIWGVILHDLIKPSQFDWGTTLKCLGFTAFVGIPVLLMMQRVPPFNLLYAATRAGWLEQIIGYVFGVGLLEEVCKALPVYLFLNRSKAGLLGKIDPVTAAFYGAMSGLGFAIAEGSEYALRYAWGVAQGDVGFSSYILINTIRFISLPLFHAIWAAIVGYFLGLAALHPARQGAIMAIGIAIAAVLHGLYDVFSGNLLGVLIIAFSILLFVTYRFRSHQLAEVMIQAERASHPRKFKS